MMIIKTNIFALIFSINFILINTCQVSFFKRAVESRNILNVQTTKSKSVENNVNKENNKNESSNVDNNNIIETENTTSIISSEIIDNRLKLQNNYFESNKIKEIVVKTANTSRKSADINENNITIENDTKTKPIFTNYVNTNNDMKETSTIIESSVSKTNIKSEKVEVKNVPFTFIQPGTKWCGAGNVADSYDDLGSERETDKCCREHDFCPDIIEAGESKYNLTNEAFYTRLSCKCDEAFRQCLRSTKRRTSTNIGTVYFNLLGTKCFRNEYPTVRCVRRGGWLKRKCLEYTYDTTSSKSYQWFDVNDY